MILEGPRQAVEDRASLLGRCQGWPTNDSRFGIAAHAGDQEMWTFVRLPIAIPEGIADQLGVGVQQQRDLQFASVHVLTGGGLEPCCYAGGVPFGSTGEQGHPRTADVRLLHDVGEDVVPAVAVDDRQPIDARSMERLGNISW